MNKFRGILIASSILTVLTASSSVWVERKDFPIVKAAEFLECTHVGLQRVPDFGIPTLSLGHQYMTISFVFPPLSNYAKIEGLLGIYEGKVIVQASGSGQRPPPVHMKRVGVLLDEIVRRVSLSCG